MTDSAALLRERLIDAVGEPMSKPALLLSGGVDSGECDLTDNWPPLYQSGKL